MRLNSSASTTLAAAPGEHEHDATEREGLEDALVLELEAADQTLALRALAVLVGDRRPLVRGVLDDGDGGGRGHPAGAGCRRWWWT